MNEFRLVRYRAEYKSGSVVDGVEPVIDAVELSDLLDARRDDGGSWTWMPYSVVAPPSRHWLGEPTSGYCSSGLVAVLDGGYGAWGCCGPGAYMRFERDRVIWEIAGLEPFAFDRGPYESAIAGLEEMPQTLFRPTDLHP